MNEMDAETLAALKESIEHWRRMANAKRNIGEEPHVSDCALCRKFLTPIEYSGQECLSCPIYQHTGRTHCRGTPYGHAAQMWDDYGPDSPEFTHNAQEELQFLESLLPKLTI